MAVTPSLGQAVALQGRNQVAEKLGQLEFQSQQNAKNRAARLGAVEAKKAGDEQQQLYKLFNDRASFSRLVQPKLQVLIDDVMTKAMTIQSSGSPSRSNEFNKVIADAYVEMSNLKMRSDAFKDFDTKIATIDKNKTFFGPQTEEFITKYYKNPNIKDYDQLAAAVRKDNFKFDNNLMLTAEGVPLFNPEPIENYQEKIATLGRSIKPTVASTQMVSLPYDKKSMTSSLVRPFKKEDAKNAYNNNPALYPQGLPVSVEDVVETYMLSNPRAVDQYVSRNKLNFIKDSETGMYSEQDEVKIKEGMMNFALQFTNPEIKDKVISKGGGINNFFGGPEEQSVMGRTKTKNILKLGENRDGSQIEYYTHDEYGLPADGYSGAVTGQTSNADGTEATGAILTDKKVVQSVVLPYGQVIVNGVTRTYPIQKGGKTAAKYILGVQPFVMFGEFGQYLYIPARNFSSSGMIGSKVEAGIVDQNISAQKADAAKATTLFNQKIKTDPVLKKMVAENKYQEINDYINNLYINGQ